MKRQYRSILTLAFCIVFMMAGCGGAGNNTGADDDDDNDDNDSNPSISVPSADGNVTLTLDETSLPDGVASGDIRITEETPPTVEGRTILLAYEFLPDGIEFLSPVTLTISLEGVDLGGTTAGELKIALISGGEVTELDTTLNEGTNTLSAQITHFCIYGVVAPAITTESDECTSGEAQSCGTDVGGCESGTKTCVNGEWGECENEVNPSDEMCDGLDNDCDGSTDEGCECINGETQSCGNDIGECESGTQTCVSGEWGECEDEVGSEEEICDGLDNDCDGEEDEGEICERDDLFLALDGDGDRAISMSTVYPNGTAASFTVEAWIYPTAYEAMYIASDDAYDLIAEIPDGRIYFKLWRSDCSSGQVNLFYGTVPLNSWTHISASYDVSADEIAVSINGELESRSTTFSGNFCSDPSYHLSVGDFYTGSLYGFSGQIDEVRISDVVRYSENFIPLEELSLDANTKGLWHFDEDAGSTSFADSSGNGHDLTAQGNAVTSE